VNNQLGLAPMLIEDQHSEFDIYARQLTCSGVRKHESLVYMMSFMRVVYELVYSWPAVSALRGKFKGCLIFFSIVFDQVT
jgi:hypothetical protein